MNEVEPVVWKVGGTLRARAPQGGALPSPVPVDLPSTGKPARSRHSPGYPLIAARA